MISDSNETGNGRKSRKITRKLTIADAEGIAKLVATRKLTETEACLMLNIKRDRWFDWKSRRRNDADFTAIVTRMKADKLAGLVEKIERAGDDWEIETEQGKIVSKRGDWRANAWIAERIAPDRFGQVQSAQVTNNTLNIGIMHDALKRVIGIAAPETGQGEELIAKPCPDMAETQKQLKSASRIPPRKS